MNNLHRKGTNFSQICQTKFPFGKIQYFKHRFSYRLNCDFE
jgi:hypothetical protein